MISRRLIEKEKGTVKRQKNKIKKKFVTERKKEI